VCTVRLSPLSRLPCSCRVSACCGPRIAGSHSDVTDITSPPPSPIATTYLSTAQILSQSLLNYSKQFKAAHINAESLRGHLDEVSEIFKPQQFDVVTISESWLKPSIRSSEVTLPGYQLFRTDRINKNCGGVAAYVKEGMKAKLLYSTPSEYSARPEFMFIEILLSGSDALLLCVCYRPPKVGHLTDLEDVLLQLMPNYCHVLIMGDFNTDLTKPDKCECKQLTTMFESCGLSILPLQPTHHTADSATLLDLIIVSDKSDITKYGQLPVPAISRHDLIYCVVSVKVPKPKVKYITYRDFKNMDEIAFLTDINQVPWHNIFDLTSVDDMVNMFNTFVSNLYNQHAPIVTKRITKRSPVPWMTKDILSLMAHRDYLFRKARKSGDVVTMNSYRQLRNRVKQLLRNSKLRYTRSLFSNNKQTSSAMWRKLKSLGFGKQQNSIAIPVPINDLNTFFTSFFQSSNNKYVEDYRHHLLQTPVNTNIVRFYFKPVISSDVLKAIRRIQSNATGSDNIPISLVKKILFAVLPIVTLIYNTSLRSGVFPSQWKSAIICPINKTPAPKTCQDYRPISILPALSKGLERIVHHQISEFLKNNDLLNIYQSGFRPNHSTETALLRVADDIRLAMDNRQGTILTLFDFSKAFDSVNHSLLLAKLRAIGFSNEVLTWLGSYLADRRQCVRVGSVLSTWEAVTCGVPQGSILGPLLFSLYVNDIYTEIKICKFHMYADDLQIYTYFTPANVNTAVEIMNSDITNIVEWTKKHGLKLNPTKTQPIVISYNRLRTCINMNDIHHITVDGVELPYYDKVKNLGITFNNTLTWTETVVDKCNKVFAAIHSLKKLQNFLPLHIKLLLVRTLIFPHFTYCSSVINDMTVALSDRLQRSQNYCVRYVYNLKRDDHVTPFYIRSQMNKLIDSRKIKILSLTHLILKTGYPKYFAENLTFLSEVSVRNSRTGSSILRMPLHRTTVYGKSFVVTACRLWNSLPLPIRSIENRARFVASLKQYYWERMSEAVAV
jgi:hypothetical protein